MEEVAAEAAAGTGNPDHRLKSLTECVVWVFSDRQGLRQSLLQQFGLKTIHYHHDLHSRQQADRSNCRSPGFFGSDLLGLQQEQENLVRLVRCQIDQGGGVVMEANALSQEPGLCQGGHQPSTGRDFAVPVKKEFGWWRTSRRSMQARAARSWLMRSAPSRSSTSERRLRVFLVSGQWS